MPQVPQPRSPPPPHPAAALVNAMSVDVEDYYQVSAFADTIRRDSWERYPSRVEDNTGRILALFEQAGIRATFFVLGCVAQRHPALIRRIVAGGHELASHGLDHIRVFEQTPREFRADITAARQRLEDTGGVAVAGYRAASFSINRATWWAFDELAGAGYRYSSSISPIRHDHYGVPDAPRFAFQPGAGTLWEIPVGTTTVLGQRLALGGGFFRLLPYWWSRLAVRALNRSERAAAVFYFHPWEIDPGQPRIATRSWRARLRHYINLAAMAGKLERLLTDFAWDRIDRLLPALIEAQPLPRPLPLPPSAGTRS